MITKILRRKSKFQTVFTFSDISRLIDRQPDKNLLSALSYHVGEGNLIRLSKGIYALDDKYSRLEFANKLRQPSYISLYSILTKHGIVFQPYTSIFLISNRSETIEITSQKYIYRKIKNQILLNFQGILEIDGVFEATPERAILDKIYLDGEEYFDNLSIINWDLATRLNETAYRSRKITAYINKMYKHA